MIYSAAIQFVLSHRVPKISLKAPESGDDRQNRREVRELWGHFIEAVFAQCFNDFCS